MKWYENRIKSAIDGTNPMVIKELSGSFAVYGDVQFLPGYCVLLPKREVASLNDLDLSERQIFLTDMTLLGDAIIQACSPLRINYELLGNTDNFLHAHFPVMNGKPTKRKKCLFGCTTNPIGLIQSITIQKKEMESEDKR